MRIAVISDIHGNMEALNTVMNDIEQKECDKIFVLGDLAMAGPEPSSAIKYFMLKEGLSNFKIIQGNTDLMIVNYNDELYNSLSEKAPIMARALKYNAFILNPIEKNFLKSLPQQIETEVDGVKFLLVHGSPRKNNEDILPSTPMVEVEKMLEGIDADVILCGHTHIPCGFQTNTKQTVVNVGSVGRPFTPEPKACYLTIDIENNQCQFQHWFLEYDKETASKKLAKQDYEGSGKLAVTLLNPKERHF